MAICTCDERPRDLQVKPEQIVHFIHVTQIAHTSPAQQNGATCIDTVSWYLNALTNGALAASQPARLPKSDSVYPLNQLQRATMKLCSGLPKSNCQAASLMVSFVAMWPIAIANYLASCQEEQRIQSTTVVPHQNTVVEAQLQECHCKTVQSKDHRQRRAVKGVTSKKRCSREAQLWWASLLVLYNIHRIYMEWTILHSNANILIRRIY